MTILPHIYLKFIYIIHYYITHAFKHYNISVLQACQQEVIMGHDIEEFEFGSNNFKKLQRQYGQIPIFRTGFGELGLTQKSAARFFASAGFFVMWRFLVYSI